MLLWFSDPLNLSRSWFRVNSSFHPCARDATIVKLCCLYLEYESHVWSWPCRSSGGNRSMPMVGKGSRYSQIRFLSVVVVVVSSTWLPLINGKVCLRVIRQRAQNVQWRRPCVRKGFDRQTQMRFSSTAGSPIARRRSSGGQSEVHLGDRRRLTTADQVWGTRTCCSSSSSGLGRGGGKGGVKTSPQ